jgi:D-amino-acid dehydrogenase
VCGLIQLSTSEGEDEWLAKGADLADRRSPGVVAAIDPEEAARMFPPLGPVRGALFNPRAARIDGRRATAAIEKAASKRGLRRVDGEVSSMKLEGDRAVGVESDAGSVAAGSVAIAGGAWSARFAEQLRVNLPIGPMKGQIIHMTLPGVQTGKWPIVQPVFSHYLVPWQGGRVACGGTLEADAGFDTSPTAGGVYELLREGLRTAPGLAGATVSEVRVGLRPASKDDRPVLGRLDEWSNVYVATGHGTGGLLLGPYSALLVTDNIVSGDVPEQIADLSSGRFATASGAQTA